MGLTQLSVAGQYVYFGRQLAGSVELDDGSRLESTLVSVAARHHFGEGWAVDAQVPMGLALVTDSMGTREGVGGFGDIELGGRYELAALWGAGGFMPSLTLRVGATLPTGARSTTSTLAGTMPTALRLGTGAFGFAAQLRYTQFLDRRVALSIPVEVRQALSSDGDGRTAGVRFSTGLEAIFFPIDWLVLRAAVTYQVADHFDLGPPGIAVNSGGNWLRAEALALFRLGDVLSLGAGARVPVYIHVNGQQLAEQITVQAVLALSLGGEAEEEEEHHHAHGERRPAHAPHETSEPPPDETPPGETPPGETPSVETPEATEPGDVSDVATGGASFELADAIAVGRVTVIDFWAQWCHPCEHIDALLRDLAAQHPELAVRRAEVTTGSTPINDTHLSDDATLPQVWIYDRAGERVERLIGASEEEVRERVEAHLAAPL